MSSMWGKNVKISIFGGSHTEAIGVTIDGLPAGERIDLEEIKAQMARRAPGRDSTATKRKEDDLPKILSGVNSEGVLTGAPISAIILNSNQKSKDYEELRVKPRPGHADFTAQVKYSGNNDIRGGGHFSGRLTAPLVFAGAVCRQILERKGIYIGSHVYSIGKIADEPFDLVNIKKEKLCKLSAQYFPVNSDSKRDEMRAEVERIAAQQDSVGGMVECAITGLPVGLGEPMFDGVENKISSIIFGIPAVKGIEFGAGFSVADKLGSENNDEFYYNEDGEIKTYTNNSGGILGGISNGMPIVFKVAIKPTPSIAKKQNTINFVEGKNDILEIAGRHDPCIVPRAAPVVEAAAAVALLDLIYERN